MLMSKCLMLFCNKSWTNPCLLVVFNFFIFARLWSNRFSYVFLLFRWPSGGRACTNDKKARHDLQIAWLRPFCFFSWPTSLSCHFCMGGLPRTLPKARIQKGFGRRTSVQKEKCWKQQGSKDFSTKINKISFGFVTRVSHVTDPTPLCKSLMHLGPFIFATRSEAKNVSFGTP